MKHVLLPRPAPPRPAAPRAHCDRSGRGVSRRHLVHLQVAGSQNERAARYIRCDAERTTTALRAAPPRPAPPRPATPRRAAPLHARPAPPRRATPLHAPPRPLASRAKNNFLMRRALGRAHARDDDSGPAWISSQSPAHRQHSATIEPSNLHRIILPSFSVS